MFPNGNIGLEYSKFYEDVPARGHLIGRAATGSCRKSTLPQGITYRIARTRNGRVKPKVGIVQLTAHDLGREQQFGPG